MTEPAPEVPRPEEVTALILAAGEGERLGGPKAFLEASGATLLERAVDVLTPFATRVLIGLRAADVSRGGDLVGDRCEALAGGATRQATFARLLARAKGELVLVHDVARPFAAPPLIERVLVAAREFGAAAPAVSASAGDSMALAEGEWLGDPLPRERVLRTQTPQAFRRGALVEAMKAAADQGWEETSVAAVARRAGAAVRLVPGDPSNVKITFPEDWTAARERLERGS